MSHTYGGVDSQNPNAPAQAPYGVPPIPKIPDDLKFPNPMEIFSDIPGRFRTFKGELQEFFSRLKYVFILPLSWFLTFASFGKNLLKRLIFLPVTISLNIYEGKIRTWWPWLPSIWGLFFALFPQGIKLPSLTTWVTGKYNGAGPTDIPTMEVDMSQFMNAGTNAAGDVANGTADGLKQAAGDLKQAGGMATAASQADTNTLNGPQSQMNQLDGVLKDVKGLPEADVIQETKEPQKRRRPPSVRSPSRGAGLSRPTTPSFPITPRVPSLPSFNKAAATSGVSLGFGDFGTRS